MPNHYILNKDKVQMKDELCHWVYQLRQSTNKFD